LKIDSPVFNWLAVACLGVIGVYYINRGLSAAGNAAGAVVDAAGNAVWAVSPTNNDNVLYQTASIPAQWLTGRQDENLGGAIYEVTHDGTLNPASTNNLIYRNLTIGGKPIGIWAYDFFNGQ